MKTLALTLSLPMIMNRPWPRAVTVEIRLMPARAIERTRLTSTAPRSSLAPSGDALTILRFMFWKRGWTCGDALAQPPAMRKFFSEIEPCVAGPIVTFGTNRPSIMSTWIQSACAASMARSSSARRPKSADKIDGATMIDLYGAASGMADPALSAFDPDLAPSHRYP